jgi:hypothetical protein
MIYGVLNIKIHTLGNAVYIQRIIYVYIVLSQRIITMITIIFCYFAYKHKQYICTIQIYHNK